MEAHVDRSGTKKLKQHSVRYPKGKVQKEGLSRSKPTTLPSMIKTAVFSALVKPNSAKCTQERFAGDFKRIRTMARKFHTSETMTAPTGVAFDHYGI